MVQHGAKMEPRWAMMVQHGTKMKPRWGQQASAVSLSVFALSFGGDKAKRNIYTNCRSTAFCGPILVVIVLRIKDVSITSTDR